jgi:hypothetical protein
MANSWIKADAVVRQGLGVLVRDVVLPNLVTRDVGLNFVGAKNDTVTLRVPAYTTARTRVMRSAQEIIIDELDETSVDVKLDTHAYKAVGITDEEMTLDIVNFGEQVSGPVMGLVVRKVEDLLATEMTTATYGTEIEIDPADPYAAIVGARAALNLANIPISGRFLAVGANVETDLLMSDRLSKVDTSGSDSALREAQIGRIAGFTAIVVPGLDPDVMIAAHKSAFVLASQVPAVPAGAGWGATASYQGFGLRVLRDYAMTTVTDRFLADVFMGTATVADNGTLNEDGTFDPSIDGTEGDVVVRAVKMSLPGSA